MIPPAHRGDPGRPPGSIASTARSVRELKESLRQHAAQFEAWLELMNTARNLERIADHAKDIAQTIVYLQEGVIIHHKSDSLAIND